MNFELTKKQIQLKQEVARFAKQEIAPFATQFDQNETIPEALIKKLAYKKYLGVLLPEAIGGMGGDMIDFIILNEELGKACSSVRSLLTVHSMVSYAISRWGSSTQKSFWLPQLAAGKTIGAFALSEPNAGSDPKAMKTKVEKEGDIFVLEGQKKWITFGDIAHVFLVFARFRDQITAFLVESNNPGLRREPIRGLLGTRASMCSNLFFNRCIIHPNAIVGRMGFGFSAIAFSALTIGRLSVAAGSVGIAQGCLEQSINYASKRKQFGDLLKNHQLIRRMLTNMIVNVKASRLLCYKAGVLLEIDENRAMNEVLVAKYFASTTANKIAKDAVQIHGGNGCFCEFTVERYFRDAKIMEIIEGSNEIHQIIIPSSLF